MKKLFCAAYWAAYLSESRCSWYAPDAPWNDTRWSSPWFEELRLAGAAELDDTKQVERAAAFLVDVAHGTAIDAFDDAVFSNSSAAFLHLKVGQTLGL